VLEDAAPLRVAKRASGAVSPIPGTASLGQQYAFGDATRDGSIAPKAATQTGVVRPKPLSSGSLWERNEFGLVAGHLREAAFLPVLLGLLDPVC
jgi:hypothetical protein